MTSLLEILLNFHLSSCIEEDFLGTKQNSNCDSNFNFKLKSSLYGSEVQQRRKNNFVSDRSRADIGLDMIR